MRNAARELVRPLDDSQRAEIQLFLTGLWKSKSAAEKFIKSCPRPGHDKLTRTVNAVIALEKDLRLNQLEGRIEVNGKPIDKISRSEFMLSITDSGKISRDDALDAITLVAARQAYHPVRKYLRGLQWDGNDHLSRFLSKIHGKGATITYGDGRPDTPIYRALITRWLLGCAVRALYGDEENPFKHQTPMLVFVGNQGAGKSALAKWLASGLGLSYHNEGTMNPDSDIHHRLMVTKWIWEVSELGASLRRSDREATKSFITQEYHSYKIPWEPYPITRPTLCNLMGTINEEKFLDDSTGERRFLPVDVVGIDHSYSQIDINQLWAQIVAMLDQGESPRLHPKENEILAGVHADHKIENPLIDYIHMYFDVAPENEDASCLTAEIINRLRDFKVTLPLDLRAASRAIGDVLHPMGLRNDKIYRDGSEGRGWYGIKPNAKITPEEQRIIDNRNYAKSRENWR